MPLKLLIADDEEIERRAVAMQIGKAFPEIELLKPARNGVELMETARRERPDAVMADIEMPGMNGLEALEKLRDEGIRPHIIIMTAYSSEHYLKESLSLRVYAYLEKPLRRERVENAVRGLLAEIEQIRAREAALDRMRSAIRSLRRMIQAELMTAVESDEADPAQTAELLDMLEMPAKRFLIMTFSTADIALADDSRYARSITELNVFEEVRRLARARGWVDGHVVNHRMSCLVPVEIGVERDDDYRLRQAACWEADAVLKQLEEVRGIRVGIGMSTTDPRLLQRSRRQSVQALHCQDRRSAICHYEDQPVLRSVENLFAGQEAPLAEYLQSGALEEAEACIRGCFASIPEWVTFDSLRNQAFEMLLAVNRRGGVQVFEDLLTRVSDGMHACRDRRDLEAYICGLCAEYVHRQSTDDSRWQEGIIQQAVRYIDDCYGADISLESTAEAIGVSRFYLSRLFKTHLGMNYSSYLVQKRVGVAEALLKARRLSNREIAELVGFRDPDYFGKVFKRQVGCTMTEYRNRIH